MKEGRHIGKLTRHIDIKYFFIHQYIESGEVVVRHCPTNMMLADVLTKPMSGKQFNALLHAIGIRNMQRGNLMGVCCNMYESENIFMALYDD